MNQAKKIPVYLAGHHLTQKALGALVKVDSGTMSRIEKGYCDLPEVIARKIGSALGIALDDIPGVLRIALPVDVMPAPPAQVVQQDIAKPDAAPPPAREPSEITRHAARADLNDPKNFNELPDRSLLLSPMTPEMRAELSRSLKRADQVLQTSGVSAEVWREWRSFEKEVREKFRTDVNDPTPTKISALNVTHAPQKVVRSPSGERDPRLGNVTVPPQETQTNERWRTMLDGEIERLRALKQSVRFAQSDYAVMRGYWKQLHATLHQLNEHEGITTIPAESQPTGYNALFFKHTQSIAGDDWFVRCKMEAAGIAASDRSKGFLRHFRLRCEQYLEQAVLDLINTAVLKSRGQCGGSGTVAYVRVADPALSHG